MKDLDTVYEESSSTNQLPMESGFSIFKYFQKYIFENTTIHFHFLVSIVFDAKVCKLKLWSFSPIQSIK